jgi:hypothetical protein
LGALEVDRPASPFKGILILQAMSATHPNVGDRLGRAAPTVSGIIRRTVQIAGSPRPGDFPNDGLDSSMATAGRSHSFPVASHLLELISLLVPTLTRVGLNDRGDGLVAVFIWFLTPLVFSSAK